VALLTCTASRMRCDPSAQCVPQHIAVGASGGTGAKQNMQLLPAAAGVGVPGGAAGVSASDSHHQQQQQEQQGLQAQPSIVHPDPKRRRLSDNAQHAVAVQQLPAAAVGAVEQLQQTPLAEAQAVADMLSSELQMLDLSHSELADLPLTHSMEQILAGSNHLLLQDVEEPAAPAAATAATAQQQQQQQAPAAAPAQPAPPAPPTPPTPSSTGDALQLIAACVQGLVRDECDTVGWCPGVRIARRR